jgi:stage V sporulation protein S
MRSPDGGGPDHVRAEAHVEVLKVSSRSNPNSVAGAMAGVVRQHGRVEVQVVGAGALNQAIKALAIARTYVEESHLDLVCIPSFADIEIDGERRTAIRLEIVDRAGRTGGEPRARAEVAEVDGNGVVDLRSIDRPAPAPAPAAVEQLH